MNPLAQNLSEICHSIQTKEYSCEELMKFYLDRIKKVNPYINAVVQMNPEQALIQAREADAILQAGKNNGPLHGIPFTAKDWLETEEFISSAGMEERRNFLPKKDATVIARLKQAGAILIGKTNIPFECSDGTENPVYGKTNNPYDLLCTPGLSSGGEAAIIAAGGAAFGIGSDSGGSIRIPCHYCGVAGLKPTTGRIPATGHYPEIGGKLDPRSQIGPIARKVADLAFIYPFLCGDDGIDPDVIDMPHYSIPNLSELKVAYYSDHPNVEVEYDILIAMKQSTEYLQKFVKDIEDVTLKQPKCLAKIIDMTKVYWNLVGESVPTIQECLTLFKEWDELSHAMKVYMGPYDALITPACPKVAYPQLPNIKTDTKVFAYTLTYSFLGWPCIAVRVDSTLQGLPINLQVVAKPFHEETCLLVAAQLENLCGWQAPKFDFLK